VEELAVDADVVAAGVGLGAQFRDGFAVYLDAALLDHLFGFAAAGDAGLGENLLEALELGGGTGAGVDSESDSSSELSPDSPSSSSSGSDAVRVAGSSVE